MAASFGHDVLSVFDVRPDSRDFLGQVIQSRAGPRAEIKRLLDQSLLAGAEDWQALVQCATSIHQSRRLRLHDLHGQDVLTSLCLLQSGELAAPPQEPWHETDRLIALAQKLENEAGTLPWRDARDVDGNGRPPSHTPTARQSGSATSHYWDHARRGDTCGGLSSCRVAAALSCSSARLPWQRPSAGGSRLDSQGPPGSGPRHAPPQEVKQDLLDASYGVDQHNEAGWGDAAPWSCRATSSPYFSDQSPAQNKRRPKRPLPGTVPCVPFPPLTRARFGIIQEEVAQDPFWLLIAVTFLIKTNGQLAIPAFRCVRDRFSTPLQLADPANEGELSDMVRHLGLVAVRVAYVQKYATAYVNNPPRPDVRCRVKNYDKRDMARLGEPPCEDEGQDAEAWEIGHMTGGRYTLDSWRIFCRDRLLGRAQDWNGKGREPEFQPEWMRVMPKDKELRAFLRWMWMREGWEWDPATGGRTVLREEMRRAVDQGRVEYDDTGGLRML